MHHNSNNNAVAQVQLYAAPVPLTATVDLLG
jgi:hypothetical protein